MQLVQFLLMVASIFMELVLHQRALSRVYCAVILKTAFGLLSCSESARQLCAVA